MVVPTAFVSSFSGIVVGRSNNVSKNAIRTLTNRVKYSRLPIRRVICSSTVTGPSSDAGPQAAEQAINDSQIMVFSTTYCPFCAQVKSLFSNLGVPHTVWDVDTMKNGDNIRAWLNDFTGQRTVPNIFIRGQHIGGCDDTFALYNSGKLTKLIEG